ncbi:hypothetical protein GC176_24710 [bacterium]|nr:hypothetical protein [bacterium]
MLRDVTLLLAVAGVSSFAGCIPSENAAVQVVALPEEALPSATAQALEHGTEFELLSLEPNGGQETEGENRFHGFEILGATAINDRATQAEIVSAFERGIADNLEGVGAACFAPRHGIRVTHDGNVHEFLICFECWITKWYINGKDAGGMSPTSVAQPVFDRVLRKASIRLPKPARA